MCGLVERCDGLIVHRVRGGHMVIDAAPVDPFGTASGRFLWIRPTSGGVCAGSPDPPAARGPKAGAREPSGAGLPARVAGGGALILIGPSSATR